MRKSEADHMLTECRKQAEDILKALRIVRRSCRAKGYKEMTDVVIAALEDEVLVNLNTDPVLWSEDGE